MNVVPARGKLDAELRGHDAGAAVRGVAGDADAHSWLWGSAGCLRTGAIQQFSMATAYSWQTESAGPASARSLSLKKTRHYGRDPSRVRVKARPPTKARNDGRGGLQVREPEC